MENHPRGVLGCVVYWYGMSKGLIKTVFIRTLPIMTGYVFLGIGFGVLLQKAGYGWVWALVMAISMYSGTMQYLGVDLLSSGASVITAAVMALVVNARYIFYGIPMIDRFKGAGWKKPMLIFGLTDENFALLCSTEAPEGSDDHLYCFLVSVFDQAYWIIGCVLGVLLGSAMRFNTQGIEFIMTALFVTIFVDQWRETKNHIPAILGVGITLACLLIFGEQSFLIPAMVIITLTLSLGRKYISGRGEVKNEVEDEGNDMMP